MKTSLIITTYNWKEALELVLLSVLKQVELPDEVIIADDGSKSDTKELIQHYQKEFPIPLIHSWQEDNGFRAAESRNKAIALSKFEYIIFIDGDMILHPYFIKEHKINAKEGCFIQGSRVLINEEKSTELLTNKTTSINILDKGIKNKFNALHFPILSSFFTKETQKITGIKTCNISFYKEHLYKVNGFNNDFVGWGREDTELVIRLYNTGINRINLKLSAIAYHLYHHENSKKLLEKNEEILQNTKDKKSTYCENGINQFLGDNNG